MKPKFISLILVALSMVGCELDLDVDNDDRKPSYENQSGRMVERISIEHGNREVDYIYYTYDRQGRITSIEDTFYQRKDLFSYYEDDRGKDYVAVSNNLGADRDIYLASSGYATKEMAYVDGLAQKSIVYGYRMGSLSSLAVQEYYRNGSLFSEESYDFDYDSNGSLYAITRYYEEDGYSVDSKLTFSSFCDYENKNNIDILSIIGLYIDDDFASQIARAGDHSKNLPTLATLRVKRNGRYDNDVDYRINYIGDNGLISTIEITSTAGLDKTYNISYVD